MSIGSRYTYFYFKIIFLSFLFFNNYYSQNNWQQISGDNLPPIYSIGLYRDSPIVGTQFGLYYYDENEDSVLPFAEEVLQNYSCYNLYSNNDKLYVVSDNGVYRYNNEWEQILSDKSGECVIAFNDTILVGSRERVYFSSNDGDTWSYLGDSAKVFEHYTIWSLYKSKNGQIFAGTSCGLFGLNEEKTDWIELESFICGDVLAFAENKDGDIYLGGADRFDGIYKSSDEGISWQQVFKPDENDAYSLTTFSILVDNSNRVLFTSNNPGGGIYISTESDTTFETMNNGVLDDGIGGLVMNSDGFLFAASFYHDKGEVFKSVNSLTDINSKEYLSEYFNLSQNYPNPFNPSTTIKYTIPSEVKPCLPAGRSQKSKMKCQT